MYKYVEGFERIREILGDFLRHGVDPGKLDPFDQAIESSQIDQVRILNSYLSLAEQRVLFGATKNIHNIIRVMKEKLKIAHMTHENPTTIELSLEILESLSHLAPHLDDFMINDKAKVSTINELSRISYKKASKLGFYQDIDTQLRDAGITQKEIKTFVEKLNENIDLEMETQDESA